MPAAEPDRTIGSRADVVTGAPARCAEQLISHRGRELACTGDATTAPATTVIGAATAGIVVGEDVLTLWVVGDDEASVTRAEQVLGSHLERFAQRESLTVTWVRTAGTPVPIPTAPAATLEESA
ncbi:DUF2218 domain-containing protein [Geodermatophilus sp. SYSU D00703]